MEFLVRERGDIKPFVLKLSFALALSFAGFLAAHLRSRRFLDKPTSGCRFFVIVGSNVDHAHNVFVVFPQRILELGARALKTSSAL